MAAYTRYYPSGTSAGAQLPAAWVNYIDSKLPDLIHAGGGTWAPSAQIILGGSGVNITGPAYLPDMRSAAIQNGYSFTVQSGANLNVLSGGNINANSGSDFYLEGDLHAETGSNINIASGSDVNVSSGGSIVLATGSDLTIGDIDDVTAATYLRYFRYTTAVTSGLLNFTEESSYNTHQYWLQGTTPTINDHMSIGLPNLGAAATLTSITAHVAGKNTSRASLPSSMPRLLFGNVSTATGSISQYDEEIDTSASVVAYEQHHEIIMSGLSQSLNGVHTVISVRGEAGGAGAIGELKVFAIDVTVQYTAVECGT